MKQHGMPRGNDCLEVPLALPVAAISGMGASAASPTCLSPPAETNGGLATCRSPMSAYFDGDGSASSFCHGLIPAASPVRFGAAVAGGTTMAPTGPAFCGSCPSACFLPLGVSLPPWGAATAGAAGAAGAGLVPAGCWPDSSLSSTAVGPTGAMGRAGARFCGGEGAGMVSLGPTARPPIAATAAFNGAGENAGGLGATSGQGQRRVLQSFEAAGVGGQQGSARPCPAAVYVDLSRLLERRGELSGVGSRAACGGC